MNSINSKYLTKKIQGDSGGPLMVKMRGKESMNTGKTANNFYWTEIGITSMTANFFDIIFDYGVCHAPGN